METVARDYSPQGVKFFYIYKALAHPGTNGYITPFRIDERLMHVAEAKRKLGSQIPWICDNMDNELKHALGNRPNSEFIIDPKGKIVSVRDWCNPEALRQDLVKLVGNIDAPTRIADLNLPTFQRSPKAATGVVKRITSPGQMSPLRITPVESKIPHYAKLRVELGGGQLYFGFFLDPLYKVHWNNKAPPLTFKIEASDEVTITPNEGTSPKMELDADADPREFLLDVQGRSSEPFKVVVRYFACDDAETFCIPVTQEYLVSFERDPDGGNRRSHGSQQNRRQPGRRAPVDGKESIEASSRWLQMMRRIPIFAALDQNKDGTISAEEIERAPKSLATLDHNQDGKISGSEIRSQTDGDSRRPNASRPR